ncbi:hypothetical protein [Palaeococcus ferrophilus]|uniref:hypothetical protein n=1 Tax=Palaeococcus ferrophilus TaxID=83868 RepID=UPI00064F1B1D|nr:hypothetical protein [Palaeococcus ferrophilus]
MITHHGGKALPEIGHAIGDAINRYYFGGETERDIADIKKNPEEFAMLVARELKENGIITDEEKTKKVILQGLPTIIRIAEKLWPENHDPEHLEKASDALNKGVENPLHILKQAGIDIEPELEEFRQLLAEISGKKAQKPRPSKAPIETSPDLSKEASRLLGIISGLKLAGADEKALRNLEEKLWGEVMTHRDNLTLAGLYAVVIGYLREGDLDGAEEFLRGFDIQL